ncbi:pyrroline-5-carboxylate reductase [Yaniella halotolerans]|uniref:pyrroline-5-carboxylate reductase n=1 Tax=Yaniella halotolerans TaxID=225453 RepID=UPI0003B4219F|nr:pyrroline-5-carboxylate reductase [Yaniella halotolerans]
MRISFIGLGHLNSAILAGLLAGGFDTSKITATTHSQASATQRSQEFGIEVIATESDPAANNTAVVNADIVVLGVKPPQMVATAQGLAAALTPDATVVSVAAGTTLETLANALPEGQPLIRTMPNVALTVGKGVVGMARGATVTDAQVEQVDAVFEGSGTVFHVAEKDLNLVAAMAGSGPGYVFRFTNALARAGTELGLDETTARQLARLTVVGAGAMLDTPDANPTALEHSIATEGGVTEAALQSMDGAGFDKVFVDALKANVARSEELGA